MEINEVSFENSLPVTGYGVGFFRIGADIFRGNRFIYKNKIFDWNGFSDSNVILNYRNEIDRNVSESCLPKSWGDSFWVLCARS